MFEIVSNNVLLKGSHRRQILAWLKRSMRLGQRIGGFAVKITIQKSGAAFVVLAQVRDQAGSFTCRARKHEVMDACRSLMHILSMQLHEQRLNRMAA